mmetsp:Transcript_20626/g.45188  ORF Transcript_20626/g.45188 Transcript_20626/m.45188 type:complete len:222 (-) Transcript_20626:100-765(-)
MVNKAEISYGVIFVFRKATSKTVVTRVAKLRTTTIVGTVTVSKAYILLNSMVKNKIVNHIQILTKGHSSSLTSPVMCGINLSPKRTRPTVTTHCRSTTAFGYGNCDITILLTIVSALPTMQYATIIIAVRKTFRPAMTERFDRAQKPGHGDQACPSRSEGPRDPRDARIRDRKAKVRLDFLDLDKTFPDGNPEVRKKFLWISISREFGIREPYWMEPLGTM